MRTIEIEIKGSKVVDVGYRYFLLFNAVSSGISKFFAYNVLEVGSEAVVVRVQGAEEKVDRYVDFVRSNFPAHAKVDGVEVRDFGGEVMDGLVFLQFLQFEKIDRAVSALLGKSLLENIVLNDTFQTNL